MSTVSLVVAIAAMLVAAITAYYTGKQSKTSNRAQITADQALGTANQALEIEKDRHRVEREPVFRATIAWKGGNTDWRALRIRQLSGPFLKALTVKLTEGQSVCFTPKAPGVAEGDFPMQASLYTETGKPSGLSPGRSVDWPMEVDLEEWDPNELEVSISCSGHNPDDHWEDIVIVATPGEEEGHVYGPITPESA
jgi:hypothetical protein